MDNLKKNKKIIIFCIVLIIFTFILLLISLKNESISEYNTENYQYLKKYKSNEYVPAYVTEEDVVKIYLNEYKNNMLFDLESAFNSLNKEYREARFKDLEGYKDYINDIISLSTYSMEVDKYSVTSINGNKVFNIFDKSGNQYIIKEKSIMNYEVYLDEYTVKIN